MQTITHQIVNIKDKVIYVFKIDNLLAWTGQIKDGSTESYGEWTILNKDESEEEINLFIKAFITQATDSINELNK
jgi:hypothetical protein